MRLLEIMSDIISSAVISEAVSPDVIYNKYYKDKFNREDFDRIVKSDPATIVRNNEIVKIGRYSKLLLNWVNSETLKIEDLPDVTEYLSLVYKHNIPVDSKKIKGLESLFKLVKKYLITKDTDFYSVLEQIPKDQYIKMFQSENWIIFKPKTEMAACHLGVGTRWCTAWGQHSLDSEYQSRDNMFDYYNKSEGIFIIVNRKNPKEKYQIHFNSKQYMDVNDVGFNFSRFLNHNPEVARFFFSGIEEKLPSSKFQEENKRINLLSGDNLRLFIQNNINNFENSKSLVKLLNSGCGDLLGFVEGIDISECGDVIEVSFEGYDSEDDILEVGDVQDSEDYYYYKLVSDSYSYDIFVTDAIRDSAYEFSKYNGWINTDYVDWIREYYLREHKIDIRKKPNFNRIFESIMKDDSSRISFPDRLEEGAYELTMEEYHDNVLSKIESISDYIEIIEGTRKTRVLINKDQFLLFLYRRKFTPNSISNIEESVTLVSEYFHDYVLAMYNIESLLFSYYNISTLPKDKFIKIYEEYVESLEEDPFIPKSCDSLTELVKFLDKNFKFDRSSGTYNYPKNSDNVVISIETHDAFYRVCDEGQVKVTYHSNGGNNTQNGYIDIKSLPHYMYNHKLFESVLTFKRYIR